MLRELTHLDLPAILIIENELQAAPWSLGIFEHCLRAGFHGWVIELEQKIIAFILISTQGGDIHVLNIGVTGRAQRQGLGYRLMNAAEEYAEQTAAKMMFLEVRRSNLKAINLYYKMGFVEIGERKNYYQDAKCAEDALILAKELIV